MANIFSRRQYLKVAGYSLVGTGAAWVVGSWRRSSQASNRYATGGTASMSGNYPDPFTDNEPNCILTCAQTKGPCYANANIIRQDITEGHIGLPMRLSFRILDAKTCQPLEKATVDIWHTDVKGIYSGETPAALCHLQDPTAAAANFMRGVQISDGNGRVDFHTIYPGWYPGRTAHIHLSITVKEEEFLATQIYFEDNLTEKIYTGHPDYAQRPHRDTTNRTDYVGGNDLSDSIVKTQDMSDGSLLGYITIGLRSSTGESLCRV